MRGELIEYNGKMMTLNAIAKEENVSRQTLTDWYKKTNNIYEAMNSLKKSLSQRNINYNGEILSLKAIANLENIKFETVKKYYDKCNDIYEAVRLAKESKIKKTGSIEYNGKMMSMTAICELNNVERHAVTRYYEQCGDIYKAIELAKESKEKQNGTIDYKGKKMTITGIANLEGIKRDTLKQYYELYNDIDKAVLLTKESQRRRKESLYRNSNTSVDSFSKRYNLSRLKVERELDNGSTLERIEQDIIKKQKKSFLMYDGTSLYKYCIDNGYNYWVISYMIEKYNVDPEEAIYQYRKNGQQIPHKWIYEKYGILFKHLLLKYGFDSNRIIKLINYEGYSLEDAITKLLFISDKSLSILESNWLYDLYYLISTSSPNELNNIYEVFFVDDNEKEILRKKHIQIEKIKRDLLLYDISQVIDIWSKDELFEMFTLYDITDKEIITIYTELYQPFNEGVINPTLEHQERIKNINEVISSSIDNNLKKEQLDKLSSQDKIYCLNKIKDIKDILKQRKEYVDGNSKKVRL